MTLLVKESKGLIRKIYICFVEDYYGGHYDDGGHTYLF
jgi:hypothetical protein